MICNLLLGLKLLKYIYGFAIKTIEQQQQYWQQLYVWDDKCDSPQCHLGR